MPDALARGSRQGIPCCLSQRADLLARIEERVVKAVVALAPQTLVLSKDESCTVQRIPDNVLIAASLQPAPEGCRTQLYSMP